MKNLFLTIILFASFFLYSCTNTSNPITEEEVRSTILNMFDSFSVESDNMENFKNFVTNDYVLYEMGQIMNADEFISFAKSFNTIEDDWVISDMKISIDKNSAHAYFKNKGRFVSLKDGKKELSTYEWHESAYLVRERGELKIKFYFSDTINQTTQPLD